MSRFYRAHDPVALAVAAAKSPFQLMPAHGPDFAEGGADNDLLTGMADAGIKIDRVIQPDLTASRLEQPAGFIASDFHQHLSVAEHCGADPVVQVKSEDCISGNLPRCAGIFQLVPGEYARPKPG